MPVDSRKSLKTRYLQPYRLATHDVCSAVLADGTVFCHSPMDCFNLDTDRQWNCCQFVPRCMTRKGYT